RRPGRARRAACTTAGTCCDAPPGRAPPRRVARYPPQLCPRARVAMGASRHGRESSRARVVTGTSRRGHESPRARERLLATRDAAPRHPARSDGLAVPEELVI